MKRDVHTRGGPIAECYCDFCLCQLPTPPVKGFCYECIKLQCYKYVNSRRSHFLHDQCQEYYDSVMVEIAE